jgi:hypothetical protein
VEWLKMKTLSSSPSTTKKKERKKKCDHETCRQASKTAGFMVHITVGEVTKVICGSKILQTLFFLIEHLKQMFPILAGVQDGERDLFSIPKCSESQGCCQKH